jgi:hypothetical protein
MNLPQSVSASLPCSKRPSPSVSLPTTAGSDIGVAIQAAFSDSSAGSAGDPAQPLFEHAGAEHPDLDTNDCRPGLVRAGQ